MFRWWKPHNAKFEILRDTGGADARILKNVQIAEDRPLKEAVLF